MARQTDDITAIMGYAKQYDKKIILSMLNSMDIVGDVEVIYNLSSTRVLPKYKANEGLRPEDVSVFNQEGPAGAFSTRSITPKVAMKILEIVPAEYRNTYFSDQMKPNAKDIPFVEAFWQAQNEKLASEINDNCFNGEDSDLIPAYNAANTYAVGARVKYTDKIYYRANAAVLANELPGVSNKWTKANNSSIAKGFGTIITQEYGNFPAANKIVTGVITNTTAFDQVTAVYQAIPQVIKNVGGVIFCSPNVAELYRQHALAKYPSNEFINVNRANVSRFIYGSDDKWVLKPVTWMAGSQRLIATPDPKKVKNLYMGTNALSDFNTIGEEVKNLHGYATIMKLSLSFQIADLEVTFVNDQA